MKPIPVAKAVFPVAGWGTRFLPATKSIPKEMLPIYDRPAIEWAVREVIEAGVTEILFITGRNKSAIEDYFDNAPELERLLEEKGQSELLAPLRNILDRAEIHYVRQREALGLGHAVLMGRSFTKGEPFLVILPDDVIHCPSPAPNPSLQMINLFAEKGGSVIALEAVSWERVPSYGVIDGEKSSERVHRVRHLVEKPPREKAPSNLTIVGRYLFTPAIMEKLATTPKGRHGEIQLTDAIGELLKEEPIFGLELLGRRYDTGTPAGMLEAIVESALRSPDSERIRKYLKSLEL